MSGSTTSNSSSQGSKKDSKRGGIDLNEGEEVRLHNTRFKGSKTTLKERQNQDDSGEDSSVSTNSTRSSRSTIKANSSSSSDDCSIISPEAEVRGELDVSTATKSNAGIKRGLSFNLADISDLSMPKVSKVQGQRSSANESDTKCMVSIKIQNPDSIKTPILGEYSVRRPNLELAINETANNDREITLGLNAVAKSKVFIAPIRIGNDVRLCYISPVQPAGKKIEYHFDMNVPVPLVYMNSESTMASMSCPVSIEVTEPEVAIQKVNIGTQTKKPSPLSRTIKSKILPTKLVKESGVEIIASKRMTRSSSRQNDKIEEARVSKASAATTISIISETEEHQENEDQSTQNNGDSLVEENPEGNESNINAAADEDDSSEEIDLIRLSLGKNLTHF